MKKTDLLDQMFELNMAIDQLNNARMIPDIDDNIDRAIDEVNTAKDIVCKYLDVFGDVED